MSLETWCAEFYPVPAEDVKPGLPAVEHSLQKWRGLTAEALARHGLRKFDQMIVDMGADARLSRPTLHITDQTCALCHHYIGDGFDDCVGCPLFKARSGERCDAPAEGEIHGPYFDFIRDDNPEPMIQWLEAARAHAGGSEQKGGDAGAGLAD